MPTLPAVQAMTQVAAYCRHGLLSIPLIFWVDEIEVFGLHCQAIGRYASCKVAGYLAIEERHAVWAVAKVLIADDPKPPEWEPDFFFWRPQYAKPLKQFTATRSTTQP